jgi:hypothetical protein
MPYRTGLSDEWENNRLAHQLSRRGAPICLIDPQRKNFHSFAHSNIVQPTGKLD